MHLLGVDSVSVPAAVREPLWQRLGVLVDDEFLSAATSIVGLDELPAAGEQILAGKVRGRILVDTSR